MSELTEVNRYLRRLSKPSLLSVCDSTGLTKRETNIILSSILEQNPLDIVADEVNMSRSALCKAKQLALIKIKDYLDNK